MWFDACKYTNFIVAYRLAGYHKHTWEETFTGMGFKTYQVDYANSPMGKCHWLDDYEYTWFVLRYS